MPTHPTIEEVLEQARLLSLEERVILLERLRSDLLQQVAALLQRIEDQECHSIMELKGLGKELWQGINVEKYIEEERSSWRR